MLNAECYFLWGPLGAAIAAPTSDGAGALLRILTLEDYNTRVVVIGTALLGLAAGVIGPFLLLRKRALMGDAVSHATLPGIAVAFIVMAAAGGSGKALPGLLLGALLAGLAGATAVLLIRASSRLKEDAALGIVLSVSFGLGVALLGVIQKMTSGNAAGLESFIYGKTASMLAGEAWTILVAAAVAIAACAALFKELALLCFDREFAAGGGWPVGLLDAGLMVLAVMVTVVGLQAVGLILMVALLIIPPAAARFWTDRLSRMVAISAALGAASGLLGSATSSLAPRLPAGAVIVVVASMFFCASMVLGSARGALWRVLARRRLSARIARQNLLRAFGELTEVRAAGGEAGAAPGPAISREDLLAERSWSPRELRRLLDSARSEGLVESAPGGEWRLTERGRAEAARVVREHRLWEMYLIAEADVAPSHVDREADSVEHVLGREMVERLERLLEDRYPPGEMPPSPHALPAPKAGGGG
jgi:manganese/zinc/iron transport system permease protein